MPARRTVRYARLRHDVHTTIYRARPVTFAMSMVLFPVRPELGKLQARRGTAAVRCD